MGLFSFSFPHKQTTAMGKKAKKAGDTIGAKLALVVKSGKYTLGHKSTLKSMRQGKAKLIIISKNIPPIRKTELEYVAWLGKVLVHHYPGSNNELGTSCGKYFPVSCMSVNDPGDSDIINVPRT